MSLITVAHSPISYVIVWMLAWFYRGCLLRCESRHIGSIIFVTITTVLNNIDLKWYEERDLRVS